MGRPGATSLPNWRTQGDGGRFRVGRGSRLFARGTVLVAPGNLKQAQGDEANCATLPPYCKLYAAVGTRMSVGAERALGRQPNFVEQVG